MLNACTLINLIIVEFNYNRGQSEALLSFSLHWSGVENKMIILNIKTFHNIVSLDVLKGHQTKYIFEGK